MITRDQVKSVAAKIGFPDLPKREFSFHAHDFITPVASDCLTVTKFTSNESADLARMWTAACFCHSENTCESWLEFRETLVLNFQFQKISIFEFRRLISHWSDRLNPDLKLAIAELRDASAKAHDSFAISVDAGLRSVVGIAPEFCAVLVWRESQNI